jgi:hypothetical protein
MVSARSSILTLRGIARLRVVWDLDWERIRPIRKLRGVIPTSLSSTRIPWSKTAFSDIWLSELAAKACLGLLLYDEAPLRGCTSHGFTPLVV